MEGDRRQLAATAVRFLCDSHRGYNYVSCDILEPILKPVYKPLASASSLHHGQHTHLDFPRRCCAVYTTATTGTIPSSPPLDIGVTLDLDDLAEALKGLTTWDERSSEPPAEQAATPEASPHPEDPPIDELLQLPIELPELELDDLSETPSDTLDLDRIFDAASLPDESNQAPEGEAKHSDPLDSIELLWALEQMEQQQHQDDDDDWMIPPPTQEPLDPAYFCRPCCSTTDNDFESQLMDAWVQANHEPEEEDTPVATTTAQPPPLSDAVRRAAQRYCHAFGVNLYGSPSSHSKLPNERSGLAHKDRILGMDWNGTFLATASQDSHVKIWEGTTCVHTLPGSSPEAECLRVAWENEDGAVLAVGNADGVVQVWGCDAEKWVLRTSLDHGDLHAHIPKPDDDAPQIYALQFVDEWRDLSDGRFLITSADDFVHVWELEDFKRGDAQQKKWQWREVWSLRFGDLHEKGYGVQVGHLTTNPKQFEQEGVASSSKEDNAFGGKERNPYGFIFVFDAAYSPQTGLLGVALSDGSLRITNSRGVCLTVLQLPGVNAHLTSLTWSSGFKLVTSAATGHVILWNLNWVHGNLQPSCLAIYEGGHALGRPLFGACFAADEKLILSWGVDGRLCLWDGTVNAEVHQPLAVLVDKNEYPIYAVQSSETKIVIGGGNGEQSFIGTPIYVYDVPETEAKSTPKKVRIATE